MKVCNEIMRRIDEADDLESFDFQISRHTAECGDCQRFASERAALRGLIGGTARVTAPVNFDAMLKARLAEAKAVKPLAWLNAAFYLRAGAVTAALVVAVFVAQYNGLFSASPAQPSQPQAVPDISGQIAAAIGNQLPTQFSGVVSNPSMPAPSPSDLRDDAGVRRMSYHLRAAGSGARPRRDAAPLIPIDAAFVDSGAIFIPGKNGERDITIPTVSVGAQPLTYVNAGRQPQSSRTVSVSF